MFNRLPCVPARLLFKLARGFVLSRGAQADDAAPLADYSQEPLMNVSVEPAS